MSDRIPWIENQFGIVPDDYEGHSEADDQYNCIAMVFCDTAQRWWPWDEPGYYWPQEPADDWFQAFCEFAISEGYEQCQNGQLEEGFEKICAYCDSFGELQHGARQDDDGWWLSKMGQGKTEDIRHRTPETIAGKDYGTCIHYFRRRKRQRAVE
jgi:hypothetical protein